MATIEGWIDWVGVPGEVRGRWEVLFTLGPWRRASETRWDKDKLVRVIVPVRDRSAATRLEKRLRKGGTLRFDVAGMRKPAPNQSPLACAKSALKWVDDIDEAPAEPEEIRKRRKGYALTIDARMAARLPEAERRIAEVEGSLDEIRDAVARKMLKLYNSKWRDGAPVLTAAAFRKKTAKVMELEIAPRTATLRFDAGDLFGDHAIEVGLSAGGKVTSIHLA